MSSKSSCAVVATEGFILWVHCSVGESSCFGGYFDRVTFRPAFSIFAFTDGITLVSFAFRLWAIVCTWRWFVCRLECKKKSLSICILVVYSLSLHWQGKHVGASLFLAPPPLKVAFPCRGVLFGPSGLVKWPLSHFRSARTSFWVCPFCNVGRGWWENWWTRWG